jgi:tripartite-type tricarboxylate transporter receptor subunit TctC
VTRNDGPSAPNTRSAAARRSLLVAAGAAALLATLPSAARADWKPTHPINLIVPWAAGGSTDQITRVVAAEMEKPLGQTIVIVNQPGASGAIGTGSALEATKDGYTWTAGAAQDLGAYETLGALKTRSTSSSASPTSR